MNEILFLFFFLVGLYHEDFSRIAQNQIRNRRELHTCVGEKEARTSVGNSTNSRNWADYSQKLRAIEFSDLHLRFFELCNLQLKCTFHSSSINFTILRTLDQQWCWPTFLQFVMICESNSHLLRAHLTHFTTLKIWLHKSALTTWIWQWIYDK